MTEVTFDTGFVELQFPGGSTTSFAGRPEEVLDAETILKLQRDPASGGEPLRQLRSALVRMPDRARSTLHGVLKDVLGDYIDSSTDNIGHALPIGGDGWSGNRFEAEGHSSHAEFSSIKSFADALIRGAAVLGPDRMASVVAGWARGEPLTYRTCNVVPIKVARALAPVSGVSIAPLPLSTVQLPGEIRALNTVPPSSYLGQTLVSVDTVARPALFRPTDDENPPGSVKASLPSRITFDLIREALALECSIHIDRGLFYAAFDDLAALVKGLSTYGTLGHLTVGEGTKTTNFETGECTLRVPDDATLEVSNTQVERLMKALRDAKPPTRVAVSRWVSAMNAGRTITDRFIDLRIALESLFLPPPPDQELKFRLTITGAWMIGRDGSDRQQVYKTLRQAYDLGSKAVHRGDVKRNSTNAALLNTALGVCRRGILRALHDGPVEDWSALILNHH